MKTSTEIPVIFYELQKKFPVKWGSIAITIGEVCHHADKDILKRRPDLEVHEKVHTEQQLETGISMWWDLYLADPDFRAKQETEAYRAQAQFIISVQPDRSKNFKVIHQLAKDLSSAMYGQIVSFKQALKIIR